MSTDNANGEHPISVYQECTGTSVDTSGFTTEKFFGDELIKKDDTLHLLDRDNYPCICTRHEDQGVCTYQNNPEYFPNIKTIYTADGSIETTTDTDGNVVDLELTLEKPDASEAEQRYLHREQIEKGTCSDGNSEDDKPCLVDSECIGTCEFENGQGIFKNPYIPGHADFNPQARKGSMFKYYQAARDQYTELPGSEVHATEWRKFEWRNIRTAGIKETNPLHPFYTKPEYRRETIGGCNKKVTTCSQPTSCALDGQCPNNGVCDTSTKTCKDATMKCTNDGTQDGVTCTKPILCSGGYLMPEGECSIDSQNPFATCISETECPAKRCTSDNQCQATSAKCLTGTGYDQGVCVGNAGALAEGEVCTADTDCAGECVQDVGQCGSDPQGAGGEGAVCNVDTDCQGACDTKAREIGQNHGVAGDECTSNAECLGKCDLDNDGFIGAIYIAGRGKCEGAGADGETCIHDDECVGVCASGTCSGTGKCRGYASDFLKEEGEVCERGFNHGCKGGCYTGMCKIGLCMSKTTCDPTKNDADDGRNPACTRHPTDCPDCDGVCQGPLSESFTFGGNQTENNVYRCRTLNTCSEDSQCNDEEKYRKIVYSEISGFGAYYDITSGKCEIQHKQGICEGTSGDKPKDRCTDHTDCDHTDSKNCIFEMDCNENTECSPTSSLTGLHECRHHTDTGSGLSRIDKCIGEAGPGLEGVDCNYDSDCAGHCNMDDSVRTGVCSGVAGKCLTTESIPVGASIPCFTNGYTNCEGVCVGSGNNGDSTEGTNCLQSDECVGTCDKATAKGLCSDAITATVAAGETCTEHVQCAGSCEAQGVCKGTTGALQFGSSCTLTDENPCAGECRTSGECRGGNGTDNIRTEGDVCTEHTECIGSCEFAGICRGNPPSGGAGAIGDSCEASSDCQGTCENIVEVTDNNGVTTLTGQCAGVPGSKANGDLCFSHSDCYGICDGLDAQTNKQCKGTLAGSLDDEAICSDHSECKGYCHGLDPDAVLGNCFGYSGLLAENETCTATSDCQGYCDFTFKCNDAVGAGTLGTPCTTGDECKGYCNRTETTGQCTGVLPNNAACTLDNQCASNRCDLSDGKLVGHGITCESEEECSALDWCSCETEYANGPKCGEKVAGISYQTRKCVIGPQGLQTDVPLQMWYLCTRERRHHNEIHRKSRDGGENQCEIDATTGFAVDDCRGLTYNVTQTNVPTYHLLRLIFKEGIPEKRVRSPAVLNETQSGMTFDFPDGDGPGFDLSPEEAMAHPDMFYLDEYGENPWFKRRCGFNPCPGIISFVNILLIICQVFFN